MVSPSKLQQPHQQQQQQQVKTLVGSIKNSKPKAERRNGQANAASVSSVRIQKGPKPLEKKLFYLDIKNHALSAKLEAKIKELGGGIELFLGKNVTVVISDRSDKPGVQGADKRKWGYTSGGSGGPPSLRSIEVPTPTPTPPTPYRSVEGPLSNSTNQRGQSTQRSKSRVDAMLERALTQPQQCSVDPLSNAISWGIPIWSTYELQSWLEKICASLNKANNNLKRDNRTGKQVRIKQLKEPFIKFESYNRESRPVFLELQAWPTLHLDGDPGTCPFDVKRKEKKEVACNKEVKENRDKNINTNLSKGKDMTRRPRATATRVRKTENTGYCEICRIEYKNVNKHVQSDQHLNFVRNDKNFLSLDNLISTGASVEAFLKINRNKDVRKECGLFSSRDHSLDNGILSSDEKSEKRSKSELDAYDGLDDDMKMMQYNGARRNLNLDTAHNLRTRAKHESGHLLRSKGRPWHEEDKPEKFFDKYVIKKQSKGTIWIEENDSEDDIMNYEEGGKARKQTNEESENQKATINGENLLDNASMNGDVDPEDVDCSRKERNSSKVTTKDSVLKESILEANSKTKLNGYEKKEARQNSIDDAENDTREVNHVEPENDVDKNIDDVNERLAPQDTEDTNSLKSLGKEDRSRSSKSARRGGRGFRGGRHRLSVEERLIEDNKEYYKVEVLGNKLRSSAIPSTNIAVSPSKEPEKSKREENQPSSEKPVVVRFKRVRKSELSLLSDEAESFMFGDPRREGEESEEESSILPKDTESDREQAGESMVISSSPLVNTSMKQENLDDDSQDSTPDRAKKRRRTQTEALLIDNTDYYKFVTPGSRLRYQAPLTGVGDAGQEMESIEQPEANVSTHSPSRVYPSRPSAEIEKMHFSFEAVPNSEPWYQTYKRQDEGDEFYYFFSEIEEPKPFLLPYEIENFPEILQKRIQNSVCRKRGRGRGGTTGSNVNLGSRLPRKSPRCHASTLAIMSTIIRRREPAPAPAPAPAQAPASVGVDGEPKKPDSAKPEKKPSEKSDDRRVDEDIKQIVLKLDDMLSEDADDLDAFDVDILKNDDQISLEPEVVPPKGPPVNLLELLDNCHEIVSGNGLENSSCASSECGELGESPLKRRKKRKNKTGWPHKMKRKLHMKQLNEELQKCNAEKEAEDGVKSEGPEMLEDAASSHASHDEDENLDERENEETEEVEREKEVAGTNKGRKKKKGRRPKSRLDKDSSQERSEPEDSSSQPVLKSVFGEEVSSRKRQSVSLEQEDSKSARLSESKGVLSSISEDSEEDSTSNNENVCVKETSSSPRKKKKQRLAISPRKRNNTTSSEASNRSADTGQLTSSPTKSAQKSHRGGEESPAPKKGSSKKRSSIKTSPLKLTPKQRKRLKRSESASEELANGITSSDVDQRRSSIDYQPVVRVTKIDDRVDGVAIASNRRLRSSSSPRSNMQPPKKRFRHAKKQLLKNS